MQPFLRLLAHTWLCQGHDDFTVSSFFVRKMLGTQYGPAGRDTISRILGTRFSSLRTRIESLNALKNLLFPKKALIRASGFQPF